MVNLNYLRATTATRPDTKGAVVEGRVKTATDAESEMVLSMLNVKGRFGGSLLRDCTVAMTFGNWG